MGKRILVTTFDREDDLLRGAETARTEGLPIVDAYTPYAVHGLDRAMGLKPSRLTWVCGAFGLSAAVFMAWFQHWTSAVDWPINIGGKPWNSLPAFAPVIFEAMVLCAGLGTVAVFFLAARLLPGRRARLVVEGVTNDRFALVVEHDGARLDVDETRALFENCNASAVEERVEEAPESRFGPDSRGEDPRWLGRLNLALAAVLLVAVGLTLLAPRDLQRRNWEVFPEMIRTPAYGAFSSNSEFPSGVTLQTPVSGAIARGKAPIRFEPTAEGEPPGRGLTNPLPADDPDVLARGERVFTRYCVACHGAAGAGNGPVAMRGYPPPNPFATGKSRGWDDGQLLHLITYGFKNMPAHGGLVARDDRWKVIHYVRHLQAQATAEAEPSEPAQEPASDKEDEPAEETAPPDTGESQS